MMIYVYTAITWALGRREWVGITGIIGMIVGILVIVGIVEG